MLRRAMACGGIMSECLENKRWGLPNGRPQHYHYTMDQRDLSISHCPCEVEICVSHKKNLFSLYNITG